MCCCCGAWAMFAVFGVQGFCLFMFNRNYNKAVKDGVITVRAAQPMSVFTGLVVLQFACGFLGKPGAIISSVCAGINVFIIMKLLTEFDKSKKINGHVKACKRYCWIFLFLSGVSALSAITNAFNMIAGLFGESGITFK